MFNEDFKHGKLFNVDSKDFPFVELRDIVKENGHTVLKVQGVFVYHLAKKNKDRPCLIADSHCISLPDHCMEDVRKILSNTDYIDAINAGKCGFQTSEYEDLKNGNGTCYSGSFIDI